MAGEGYVKQVWEDGVSPVNAERLNHMEYGIELVVNAALDALAGGGCMVVNITMRSSSSGTADKTLDEIVAAAEEGVFVWARMYGEGYACLPLALYVPHTAAAFTGFVPSGSELMSIRISVNSDGTVNILMS